MFKFFFNFFALFFLLTSAAQSSEPQTLYLTWQQDPTTTMTITWLTPISDHTDLLEYRQKNKETWQPASAWHTPFPDGRSYMLHRSELTGLEPGKVYLFRLGNAGEIHRFKTLPNKLDAPINFVVGGDMFSEELAPFEETNQAAAATRPAFAVIGGDIAYAGATVTWKKESAQRWVTWLQAWTKQMVTAAPDSLMIPVVAAVGNHDVNGGFGKNPQNAPIFYLLFPTKEDNSGYRVVDVGDYLSLILLDSGHTHAIGGTQQAWLEQMLAGRQGKRYKFAFYHVPAWPSVRDPNEALNKQVRKFWVPLFDRYGLDTAFEHHEHAYKRTHRLLDGKPNPKGVLYLGDGAWGVKLRQPKSPKQRDYLVKTLFQRHFFLVTLEKNAAQAKAITPEGAIFDEVSLTK